MRPPVCRVASIPFRVAGAVTATLHTGGRIAGTITAGDTALPLNQAEACAVRAGGSGREYCAHTSSDGTYTIGSLPTGTYEVVFEPSYADRRYLPERYA